MKRDTRPIPRALVPVLLAMILMLTSCGGGGGGGGSSQGAVPAPPLPPPPPAAPIVTPRLASVTLTQAQQFQAGETDVAWSVDGINGGNGAIGTISATGQYQPPSSAGVHQVVATRITDRTRSAAVTVAVNDIPGVFTYQSDLGRTGQNLNERVLSPATLNSTRFGKLVSLTVDGFVYAEPLYVANLPIPGHGTHNVVFVATQHDSVFAFDADGSSLSPLWHDSFIDPAAGVTTVSSADVSSNDIVPEIGITGTPVIDPVGQTLYVVAKTKESGLFVQRLHALDLATGAEKLGGPVVVQATSPGTGVGGVNNTISFDALIENQRCALLLVNGIVYVAWASHGDNGPYHGWVLGYDATTLALVSVLNDCPNGSEAGIWMSGGGPSADSSGNLFFSTGNGTFDADRGGTDFGSSVLKVQPAGGLLSLLDFFTPFNQDTLSAQDQDLGSSQCVLLPDQPGPHPHLLITSSKEPRIYLLDRDNLGHFHAGDDSQIVQSLSHATGRTLSSPALFGNNVYFQGIGDFIRSFALSNGLLSSTSTSQGKTQFGFPGATPAVSASGANNGVVWTLQADGFAQSRPAVLHAFDAADVSRELYNSGQAGTRDTCGPAVKFSVPTVANGKVYVGGQGTLTIYGLLP